jgi:hypothetical protein
MAKRGGERLMNYEPAEPPARGRADVVFAREIAFIDPNVDDLATLLSHLRPEVGAILLDETCSAPAQIARALARNSEEAPAAVHIIAHGREGKVSLASGNLSLETFPKHRADLERIGAALGGGTLNLWSCHTGNGKAGQAFLEAFAKITGKGIAASEGLVGAAGRGGSWELRAGAPGTAAAKPPLTPEGVVQYCGVLGHATSEERPTGAVGATGPMGAASYPGVLNDYIRIDTKGAPVMLETGAYSLVAKIDGKTQTVGDFAVLKGRPHNILVKVANLRSNYTVHAGPDGNLGDGQITVYDSRGNYSQPAALALLGPDGDAIAVRPIAMPLSAPQPTPPPRVGDQPQSPANSRKTR